MRSGRRSRLRGGRGLRDALDRRRGEGGRRGRTGPTVEGERVRTRRCGNGGTRGNGRHDGRAGGDSKGGSARARRGRRRCRKGCPGGFRTLAGEDGLLHLVEEPLCVEGLVGVVVRARLAPAVRVVGAVAARQQHDGDSLVPRADLPREGVPVVALEGGVDDGCDRLLRQLREGLRGVLRHDDAEIIAGEGDLEDLAHRDAVVDSEQGLGHVGLSPLPEKWRAGCAIVRTGGTECQAIVRTALIPPELEGALDRAVRGVFGSSWGQARAWIEGGKVRVGEGVVLDQTARVRAGERLVLDVRSPRSRPTDLPDSAVVYLDAQVIVVSKPPGISTIPYAEDPALPGRSRDPGGMQDTLEARVRRWLEKQRDRGGPSRAGPAKQAARRPRVRPNLGVVHRLDKETSGLVVFTRTWVAKQSLAAQFRSHEVHRRYLAIAHGTVHGGTLRTHLVENRGDGLRGSARGPQPRPARGSPSPTSSASRRSRARRWSPASWRRGGPTRSAST